VTGRVSAPAFAKWDKQVYGDTHPENQVMTKARPSRPSKSPRPAWREPRPGGEDQGGEGDLAGKGGISSGISSQLFGTIGGRPVTLFTLVNRSGASARITDLGGTVVSLRMPDRDGLLDEVVLGFGNLRAYESNPPFFGSLIGRCANRIGRGRFVLDGQTYRLPVNNGDHSIHGGPGGFHAVIWQARARMTPRGPSLVLTHVSPDGDQGYPGTLKVTATYTLTDRNELKLVYRAETDRPTIANFSQHNYFNLAGEGSGTILGHRVMLKASCFTPIDANLLPTGELKPVEGTPFDFRKPHPIGERIDRDDPQLRIAGGYDHNWVADKKPGKPGLVAVVEEPNSGRVLEVLTDQPGVQFYTGNFLDGTLRGRGRKTHRRRTGFCLEPQHFPNSPNRPEFPTIELRPGDLYRNTIIYRFSVSGSP
jgi:aldose 1-epimerase